MKNTFQSKKCTPSYIQHVIISISKVQTGLKLLNLYTILIGQKYTVPRYKLISHFKFLIENQERWVSLDAYLTCSPICEM